MSDGEQDNHRKKLFVKENGRPAKFFFHSSISEAQRQKLTDDIEAYGGRVASTDDRVDTVLISATADQRLLRTRYGTSDSKHKRATHVERLSFVGRCIRRKQFKHRAPVIKGMGGLVGQRHRRAFTSSDDKHLCTHLARALPHKEAGGRAGNLVYQQMIQLGEKFPEEFGWTLRHTWHAWRERYKNRQRIFDGIITEIAKAQGTFDKPIWPMDRRVPKSGRRVRHTEEDSSEEYSEDEEDQLRYEEEEESSQSEEEQRLDGDPHDQEFEALHDDDDLDKPHVQDVPSEPGEIKKRKRKQRDSLPRQVAKKRRNDRDNSPSTPAKSKGKEIDESDEDLDDDEEILNSIDANEQVPLEDLEDNAPGPSNVLQPPNRPLADSSSRTNHHELNFTQDTLVNTQSRIEFQPVSHSTSANRRHSGNTSGVQHMSSNMERESQLLFDLPLQPPSPQPPVQGVAPGTSKVRQQAPSDPTEPDQPTRRAPKPRSEKRDPFNVVPSNDAPYRNTRARSRSVEPAVMLPPKPKISRRGKQKPGVAESMPEASSALAVPETIKEEMDVENILITDAANTSAVAMARDPSLETDDAQTRQNLRASSTVVVKRSTGKRVGINADFLWRKFNESSSSRRDSILPLERPLTQNILASDEIRQPRLNQPFGSFKPPEPRTPPARQESTSSTGSFPLKSTRASAAKKERREQEKFAPYKPLEGTRAAKLARYR